MKILNVDVNTYPFQGHSLQDILTTLFSPLISKYTKSEIKINKVKVERFKKHLKIDNDLLCPIDKLYEEGCKFVLAGGKLISFINNDHASSNDYDLWFYSGPDLRAALKIIEKLGYKILVHKSHCTEYYNHETGIKLQVMHRVYACIEEIFSIFDFRCVCIAYDGSNILWKRKALYDVLNKALIIDQIIPHPHMISRVAKYASKGFSISEPYDTLCALSHMLTLKINSDISKSKKDLLDAYDLTNVPRMPVREIMETEYP